jgi:hypothetical protein
MAGGTQRLPVSEAIAVPTVGDGHHVVSVVRLVYTPAFHAGKGVACEHGQTPESVCLVAVATGCGIRPA